MESELDVLKQLLRRSFSEAELMDLFYRYQTSYRVLLHLVQQPRFPEKHSLNIIPQLIPIDLIKVVKNKHTHPGIRKRSEGSFNSFVTNSQAHSIASFLK